MTDTIRRVTVTVALLICALGTAAGFGLIGTRVEESSEGALSDTATLLAPASPAFSIWSVIYVGLLAYVVWQWLPRSATHPRARATGWLAAASMVLNAAWLGVTQVGWLWASVVVIVLLVIVLGLLGVVMTHHRASDRFELLALDGTFGLYLGWVTVATCANITAVLVAEGVSFGAADPWIAVAVLAVAAAIGVLLAMRLGGRWAVAGALCWGLLWITIGRLTSEPRSTVVGVAAAVAAIVVAAATVAQRRHAPAVRKPSDV